MTVFKSFIENKLFFLVHLKGLLRGFHRESFSQFGEDIILSSIFKGKDNGLFVDVGAYHPFHYSNTQLLYKKGWRGINIEPNPVALTLFNLHRKRDININCGISSQVANKKYYIFNHQSCNTFSEEQKDQVLKKKFIKLLRTIQLSCKPLQSVLDECIPGKSIDLLNVDVEGQNLEVLRSIDWDKNKPNVICVEDDVFSFKEGSEIYNLLSGHSYKLHSRVGLSCIYTKT